MILNLSCLIKSSIQRNLISQPCFDSWLLISTFYNSATPQLFGWNEFTSSSNREGAVCLNVTLWKANWGHLATTWHTHILITTPPNSDGCFELSGGPCICYLVYLNTPLNTTTINNIEKHNVTRRVITQKGVFRLLTVKTITVLDQETQWTLDLWIHRWYTYRS